MLKKYFSCSCGCAVMMVTKDHQYNETNVTIYRDHYADVGTWKAKLRHIWYILRYGHPYYDEIILNKEDSETLKNFL